MDSKSSRISCIIVAYIDYLHDKLLKLHTMKIDRKFFYDSVRKSLFGGKLSQSQVLGLETILREFENKHSEIGIHQLAYIFATAYHEVNKTMKPIEEYGKGKTRTYGRKIKMSRQPYNKPDKLYYGRGFVQLTWFENYEKASKKLGVDFLNNPELALNIEHATSIMFEGMIEGWFTTKKLSDYFNAKGHDPVNARRIINGKDKAELIKDYYYHFVTALKLI